MDRPPVRPRGAGRGRSIKPLVGVHDDGPGDAAVDLAGARLDARPGRSPAGSTRGTAGSTPTPWRPASSTRRSATAWPWAPIPDRIALLDNFCWGNTERPETLGSLVLAAQACHDLALAYGTPFISGKDSLNNEYTHEGQSLAIPPTLLISAIGQVPDVRRCVTMDLKEPGNVLLLVGMTRLELGGSHWAELHGPDGGACPGSTPSWACALFRAVHAAISAGWSGAATT